jgi:hypothetical protein
MNQNGKTRSLLASGLTSTVAIEFALTATQSPQSLPPQALGRMPSGVFRDVEEGHLQAALTLVHPHPTQEVAVIHVLEYRLGLLISSESPTNIRYANNGSNLKRRIQRSNLLPRLRIWIMHNTCQCAKAEPAKVRLVVSMAYKSADTTSLPEIQFLYPLG